jgi:hypothetical protein
LRSLYHKVLPRTEDHAERDVQLTADPDNAEAGFNLRVGDPAAHDLSIWLSWQDLCDLVNAAEAYLEGEPDQPEGE